jgi:hypothetical protein
LSGYLLADSLISLFLLTSAMALLLTAIASSGINGRRWEAAAEEIVSLHNSLHIDPDGPVLNE